MLTHISSILKEPSAHLQLSVNGPRQMSPATSRNWLGISSTERHEPVISCAFQTLGRTDSNAIASQPPLLPTQTQPLSINERVGSPASNTDAARIQIREFKLTPWRRGETLFNKRLREHYHYEVSTLNQPTSSTPLVSTTTTTTTTTMCCHGTLYILCNADCPYGFAFTTRKCEKVPIYAVSSFIFLLLLLFSYR
jgi:hypothetical protein